MPTFAELFGTIANPATGTPMRKPLKHKPKHFDPGKYAAGMKSLAEVSDTIGIDVEANGSRISVDPKSGIAFLRNEKEELYQDELNDIVSFHDIIKPYIFKKVWLRKPSFGVPAFTKGEVIGYFSDTSVLGGDFVCGILEGRFGAMGWDKGNYGWHSETYLRQPNPSLKLVYIDLEDLAW